MEQSADSAEVQANNVIVRNNGAGTVETDIIIGTTATLNDLLLNEPGNP